MKATTRVHGEASDATHRYRAGISVLFRLLVLATFITGGCTRHLPKEPRVDHQAVKRIHPGISEVRLLALLRIPPHSREESETLFLVFRKKSGTSRGCVIVKSTWYGWHYDADRNIFVETTGGKVQQILIKERLDIPPDQKSLVEAWMDRLLVGM